MENRAGASGLDAYATELFGSEDTALKNARNRAERINPDMLVSAREGRILNVLATIACAEKAVEIGSFTGYSGIWIGRALSGEKKMFTLELNHEHA
ncbi:MAG: hypothetical protein KDD25_01060, partial [Bdellovibrionales bacterium]|nr:hypothetical protein [Bdellovibrionales bacterium]